MTFHYKGLIGRLKMELRLLGDNLDTHVLFVLCLLYPIGGYIFNYREFLHPGAIIIRKKNGKFNKIGFGSSVGKICSLSGSIQKYYKIFFEKIQTRDKFEPFFVKNFKGAQKF